MTLGSLPLKVLDLIDFVGFASLLKHQQHRGCGRNSNSEADERELDASTRRNRSALLGCSTPVNMKSLKIHFSSKCNQGLESAPP